jgi:hypothetical protein
MTGKAGDRMLGKRPPTAEAWNQGGAEYLPGLLGIVFVKVGPDEVVAKVAVRKALMASNGYLHAGTVVTLADTCCGYGTFSRRVRSRCQCAARAAGSRPNARPRCPGARSCRREAEPNRHRAA